LLATCQLWFGLADAGTLAKAVIAKASANAIFVVMVTLRFC
jgi:hypothetical protein